jgi:hypothetical protein
LRQDGACSSDRISLSTLSAPLEIKKSAATDGSTTEIVEVFSVSAIFQKNKFWSNIFKQVFKSARGLEIFLSNLSRFFKNKMDDGDGGNSSQPFLSNPPLTRTDRKYRSRGEYHMGFGAKPQKIFG